MNPSGKYTAFGKGETANLLKLLVEPTSSVYCNSCKNGLSAVLRTSSCLTAATISKLAPFHFIYLFIIIVPVPVLGHSSWFSSGVWNSCC